MAKKPSIVDMFTPTEQPAPPPSPAPSVAPQVDPSRAAADVDIPAEGRTLATGVGLKESELELLDGIAAQLGVARNGLIRYAVRYFLKAYLAGDVRPETQKQYSERGQKQLRMD